MTKRLTEDHENARYMASLLQRIPGVALDPSSVQINMVFFRVDRPIDVLDAVQERMRTEGVKINSHDSGEFRFVTSNDVTREDVDSVVGALRRAIG